MARWELDARIRPRVSDHHLAEEPAKFLGFTRLARALGIDKTRAKLLGRRQLAGLKKRHEIIEFLDRILHGSGREQEQILAGQAVYRLPRLRVAIAQIMRFIHDEDIPLDLPCDLKLRGLFQRMKARDQGAVFGPEVPGIATGIGMIGGDGGKAEFLVQLLFPLIHERWHGEDEEALDHAAREQFFNDKTRLDRLAQAHFIREQSAPAQRPQNSHRGAQLMLQMLHLAIREAEQVIGLIGNPPERRPFPQKESAQIREGKDGVLKGERRRLEDAGNPRKRELLFCRRSGGFIFYRQFPLSLALGLPPSGLLTIFHSPVLTGSVCALLRF